MTNQNDTQDEAERLDHPCRQTCSGWKQGHDKGYREGVATKESEIRALLGLRQMDAKSFTAWVSRYEALREELNQSKRETQAAVHLCEQSRAEVERLKEKLESAEDEVAGHICGYCLEHDHKDCRHSDQLADEKQKAQKLVEALEIYANRVCEFTDGGGGRVFYKNGSDNPPALPFYSGEQWELGHHAEKALSEYNDSTDSGDGEKG